MTLPVNITQGTKMSIPVGKSDIEQSLGRIILLYGDSGLGKSTNGKFFAMHQYEKTGLPVRVVTAEDSSKLIFDPLEKAGICQCLHLSKPNFVVDVMMGLTRGLWPKNNAWMIGDKWLPEVWEPVKAGECGGYVFEGCESIGELELQKFTDAGEFSDRNDSVLLASGGKLMLTAQAQYGKVQQLMLQHIRQSGMLPVDRVMWTAHETKGSQDGIIIRGPSVVGSAITDKIQKYCGTLLHIDGIKGRDGKITRRIYFERHADENKIGAQEYNESRGNTTIKKVRFVQADANTAAIFYPAKTTIPSEQVGKLLEAFPGGYFDPGTEYGQGLDKFLKKEAELLSNQTDVFSTWKAGVDNR
jgi:hypothetical protein